MGKKRRHPQRKNTKRPRPRTRPLLLRPISPPRRRDFCGAIRYDAGRPRQDTIIEILRRCLQASLGKTTVTTDDIGAFFTKKGIPRELFINSCSTGWLSNPEVGNEVYGVLQQAGYSGSIDDLWSSVYNIVKPSKATAWIPTSESEGEQREMGAHTTVLPQIILYVRMGHSDERRKVRRMLHATKVDVREELKMADGHTTAFKVSGSTDQLRSAALSPCVLRWELYPSGPVTQSNEAWVHFIGSGQTRKPGSHRSPS